MPMLSQAICSAILILTLLPVMSLAAPQSREQQRCITALNSGFAKVAKTRSKALLRCAKAVGKGDSRAACEDQQAAKLERALAKVTSAEGKKCGTAPEFGPVDVAALGDAAVGLADASLSDLFGNSLESVLADPNAEKDTSRCQLRMIKAAAKCALARVQAFNRCKKAGLKAGTVASAEDLAACLGDDPGGRLAKVCTGKLEKAAARCDGVDLPSSFPACAPSDGASLAACTDGRLACRASAALADADALDVPGCGSITPTADAASASSTAIGTDGGELTSVGADGTTFRLVVPPGALLAETEITMTPVIAISDLPLTGGLLAAVSFAPDGLQLWEPATLTVDLPEAPDSATLAGFAWKGSGEDVQLALVAVDGSQLTFTVTHFSGAGAAIVAPENYAALLALPPGSVEQQFLNQSSQVDVDDPNSIAQWLSAWFDQGVAPLLAAAGGSDEALLAGLSEFVSWRAHIQFTAFAVGLEPEFLLGLDGFALANRVDAGLAQAAPALAAGVERNHAACLAEEELAYAESAFRWILVAGALGLATEENGLDPGATLADFCVEVVYDVLSYPDSPTIGVAGTLMVKTGYAFGGGTPFFDQDFQILIAPTGTVEPFMELLAPSGVAETSYTPTGTVELSLILDSCLHTPDDYPAIDELVCQTAILVRGFEITPETATLAPGETADFDALLYGGPHPSVTWSAAGGEISASGIYTAGDTEGTFNVTATSNLSGASESAAVTIGAGTGGALDVQDLVGTASAIGGTCPFGQISDPQSAGLADLPGFSLLASAPSDGSGTSNLDFSFTEDSGTGVVTIETDSDSVTTGVVCDGGPPPVANGQGQGHMRFDFDLPSAYAASLSGSVSGAGDYEVSVRLLSLPSGDNTFYCLILHDSPGEPMSCPGGGALSDSGSLPAGSWRLDVLQDSEGWLQFPSSSAGFDLTLTLTPE